MKGNGDVQMLNIYGLDNIGYMTIAYETQGGGGGEENSAVALNGSVPDATPSSAETSTALEAAPGLTDLVPPDSSASISSGVTQLSTGGGGGGGTVIRVDSRYYYLKDHLGTIKMTVDANGNVTSYDDYYPFGMVMAGRSGNFGQGDTRYKFISKERDVETGYDWLGARGYDSRIGRFLTIDPLQDDNPEVNPYHYAFNNPVRFIDPTGLDGEDNVKKDDDPKKIYILPEVVITPEQPSWAMMFLGLAGSGLVEYAPHPGLKIAGSVILGSIAAYQFLKPFLSENKKAEPASQSKQNAKIKKERNPAQDKKLTSSEIRKLKEKGYDPHELKDYQKGKDIYKDKDGNLYIKPSNGQGPGEPLNININNL
jgi:RHS repeat-associated protein